MTDHPKPVSEICMEALRKSFGVDAAMVVLVRRDRTTGDLMFSVSTTGAAEADKRAAKHWAGLNAATLQAELSACYRYAVSPSYDRVEAIRDSIK